MVTNGHELFLKPTTKTRDKFRVGHEPWNKGTKGVMKQNSGSFKPGILPKNKCKPGTISTRIDKRTGVVTLIIYLGKSKPEYLSRYIWRRHYGKIPKGRIIAFKDGNSQNCKLENLMMITRAENIRRNVNRQKASESAKKLWRIERMRVNSGLEPLTKIGINLKNKLSWSISQN